MSFTSFGFLVFVVITVGLYYLVPKRWKWVELLAASYAFYLISSPKTFVFVLFTTVVTFLGGKAIGNCNARHKDYLKEHKSQLSRDDKKALKAKTQSIKKRYVAITLIANLGVLACLKYFRYYIPGLELRLDSLLIPMGISFYTFQSVAYIIDLYRNKMESDTNIAKFALFTAFFPQIIQGPISRHDQLAHQLYEGHSFEYKNLCHGAQLILWGFIKKLIIADRVATLTSEVFDNYGEYSGGMVFVGLLFYTIQIYADFSGGIDIARGVAQSMGINMTHNFQRPYFSHNLSEFWNRWHISLSHWCRDYIFYPIAMSKLFGKIGKNLRSVLGDRVGKLFPVIVAQFATFLTIGIWHGAEFKYIAYGLYNGIIIVSGLLLEPYFKGAIEKLNINVKSKGWQLFQYIRTFFIILMGRIFPKSASFTVAIGMFISMFRGSETMPFSEAINNVGLDLADYILILVGCIVWFFLSLYQERNGSVRDFLDKKSLPIRWAVYLGALIAVLIFGIYGPGYDAAAFIYRGF